MDYNQNNDNTAYRILSEPFKTLDHVCIALDVSRETIEKWMNRPSFKDAVEKGLMKGKASARDMVRQLSITSNPGMNLKLLWDLGKDIYDWGKEENTLELDSDREWTIKVVGD
jgi:hypothetical protein